MTITRNFKLCLNAGTQNAPYINVNQYDEGEEWVFDLYTEGGQKFTPSTGAIIGIKADGNAILNSGTVNASGQVVITETQQMTAASGLAVFELLIEGETHGTANFIVNVERRPSDDAEFSDSDLSMLQEAIDSAAEIEDLLGGQDVPTVITPIISDWLDENITNPSNPPIDTSLTISNAAADAKVVGDKIDGLKTQIDNNFDFFQNGEAKQVFNGGDVDVTIPFDNKASSNMIKIAHTAITYSSATSFCVQWKETPSGANNDIIRQSGNQSAMEALYYVPTNAKYLRIVMHSTSDTTASITNYKRDNYTGYKNLFEWSPQEGYTDAENYYILADLIAGKTYHFRFLCSGFDSSNNSHAVVQSCNLYTLAQHADTEDIFRYTTATANRGTWEIEGKFVDVAYTPAQDANCIRIYLTKFTASAKFVMLSKEIESDKKIIFDNVTQGLTKYIVDNGVPKPFKRIGTFGSSIGGLEALTIINNKLVTASLGSGGTYSVWDSFDHPLHHVDMTSTKVSHVISMDAMKSGNLIVANAESDSVRPVYELDPTTLETITTFNVPATSPDDNDAVLYFVGELLSGKLVTIYATSVSEGNKKFWAYEFNPSNNTTTLKTTFNVNVRYFQDGCMNGDFAYIIGNWGYIDSTTSGNNVLIIVDCSSWQLVKTVDFKNFVEIEGCAFIKSNTNNTRMIFGENGGAWLYSVDL